MRGEVSDKMDVYSFGVVLLEIITSIPAIGKINTSFCLICYVYCVGQLPAPGPKLMH